MKCWWKFTNSKSVLPQTKFEYQMSLEPVKQTCCSPLKQDTCKVLKNEPCGARFGTAIAAVKDLNLDGYNDIVIGSPLEDDHRGAVYIYHGHGKAISKRYSQVWSKTLQVASCSNVYDVYNSVFPTQNEAVTWPVVTASFLNCSILSNSYWFNWIRILILLKNILTRFY